MNLAERLQPLPILRTPRLILRKLSIVDAGDYFAFAGNAQVTRFLRWGPHASLEDTKSYLSGVQESPEDGTDLLWGIELAQEGRLAGTVHLMKIDTHDLKADVGVVVNASYWRCGIGSEALRRVLAFSFEDLGLQRVQGLPITGNTPACRMLEKCGMAHEGTLRRFALQKGHWCDFEVYSILAGELPGNRPGESDDAS